MSYVFVALFFRTFYEIGIHFMAWRYAPVEGLWLYGPSSSVRGLSFLKTPELEYYQETETL